MLLRNSWPEQPAHTPSTSYLRPQLPLPQQQKVDDTFLPQQWWNVDMAQGT